MSNLRQRTNRPNRVDASEASYASEADASLDASSASSPTDSLPTISSTDFGEQLDFDDATRSDEDADSLKHLREDEDDVEVDVSSDDDDDKTLHSNSSPTSFNSHVEDAVSLDSAAHEISLSDFSLAGSTMTTETNDVEDLTPGGMTLNIRPASGYLSSPDSLFADEKALLTLPDLTSPEPPLKVTGHEVRRAASLLRKGGGGGIGDGVKGHSRSRRRRSMTDDDFKFEDDEKDNIDRLLKAPTSDYSSISRSSSPASGALRQISRRLCESVTSLDSVSSTISSTPHARSHRPKLSHYKRQKVEKILSTLRSDPSDVSAVRQLAISRSGLVTNDVRALAWPKLLNVDPNRKLRRRSWEELTRHRDYDQVVLDVRRSLRRFPPGLTQEEQELLQVKLNTLILRVLCEHQDLHYYQGYHDICVTFLLAVGEDMAFSLMDRLSTHHLRDFMDKTMERTTHLLNYLLPLVGRVNPELRDYVEAAGVGTIFSLSWLITWYGHVLNELKNIVRLYDFFLACHPLMPLYLAAAIVIHRERDIMDTECDFAMLHCTLSKVPEDLPWETLISKAGDYFIQFPPSDLAAEAEFIYQKGVSARESRLAARREGGGGRGNAIRGRGSGQVMTRNKDGVWIPLDQPKKVAARIVMWTLYASVGAAAYAVYSAGGFGWFWSGP